MTKKEIEYIEELQKRSYWTGDEDLIVKLYQQTQELQNQFDELAQSSVHNRRVVEKENKELKSDLKDLIWLVDKGATHEELIERIKLITKNKNDE